MSRKILLLNLILLVLLVWIGRTMWQGWTQARQREAATLSRPPAPAEQLPPPAPATVEPATAADYLEVAQNTLFSADRDPNVVIEAPPPEPPPPVPGLPVYHGQMGFGEPVILLSLDGSDQKGYKAGDQVGEFTLVAFDRDNVTFEWNGETMERPVEELRPQPGQQASASAPGQLGVARSGAARNAPGGTPARPGAPGPAVQGSIENLLAPAPGTPPPVPAQPKPVPQSNVNRNSDEPELGREVGGFRTCVAGDTSPAGTVQDGWRKVISQTLMGRECHWQKIQ